MGGAPAGNGSEAADAAATAAGNGEGTHETLPAPEDLAARLQPEVLATMDELFRAKWTVVKRVRREDLKGG